MMNILRVPLDPVQLRDLAQRAVQWWLAELGAFVPPNLRGHFGSCSPRMILDICDDQVVLSEAVGGAFTETVTMPADKLLDTGNTTSTKLHGLTGRRVTVRLSRKSVLTLTAELPLAAAGKLRHMLPYEIERQTPLEADRVYFDFRILWRDRSRGMLGAEVTVVRRDIIDRCMRVAERLGVEPTGFAIQGDQAATLLLLPGRASARSPTARQRTRVALAGVAVVLAAAVLAVGVWQRGQSTQLLQAELDHATAEMHAVAQIKGDIARLADQLEFVPRAKMRSNGTRVIDEVTRLLPDNAWLTELQIDGGEVRIRGYSTEASALIGLFGASPQFANAQFRAPLVQGAKGEAERFDISFDIREAARK